MCFSLEWVRDLLILLICIGGLVAILKVLVPLICSWLGIALNPAIMQIINILVAIIVLCALVYLVFAVLECALGGGLFRHASALPFRLAA
jgi:flagellar biosynthesis protein FlhB